MLKSTQTVQNKVLSRIYGKGRGWVFTPNHFLDLGTRKATDMALSRLRDAGTIRHLARGLYDYPKQHPKLGVLSPSPDAVAQAIAKSEATKLQPTGAYAVNRLGLSQQVPAQIVYLTGASEKTVQIGKQTIQLKRTTPKNIATAGTTSGLVIQAFRYLGKDGVQPEHIASLKHTLTAEDRERVWKDRRHAPIWMHPLLEQLKEVD